MTKRLSVSEKADIFARIRTMHELGLGITRISNELGRHRNTVASWMYRDMRMLPNKDDESYKIIQAEKGIIRKKEMARKPVSDLPTVQRKCLRCTNSFEAVGRFNRLCASCTEFARNNSWAGE